MLLALADNGDMSHLPPAVRQTLIVKFTISLHQNQANTDSAIYMQGNNMIASLKLMLQVFGQCICNREERLQHTKFICYVI
ncbi:MAG: hypothetical protein A3H31_06570 [Gallionellales bacterium RIFCSPLOWO2_02_FULL_57_47]|nr:MAG: hypothetical protein A3H31_06570 [Gallionellales bacterium RIFCSPLOWO2_02_FULL_57_47]OGT17039.1 MAG: hypothetical protein A3J49_07820 [Gallionellales bacterium RIFCSPHIGHO2_02_FULL_57_16]